MAGIGNVPPGQRQPRMSAVVAHRPAEQPQPGWLDASGVAPAPENRRDTTFGESCPSLDTTAAVARLFRSKTVLIALARGRRSAVAGTTFGYAALSTNVTLSLDGEDRAGPRHGRHRRRRPRGRGHRGRRARHGRARPRRADRRRHRIAVRFGREVELDVDGKTSTHWVPRPTSTRAGRARRALRRRRAVGQPRHDDRPRRPRLEVVTPKTLKLELAGKKAMNRERHRAHRRRRPEELDVDARQVRRDQARARRRGRGRRQGRLHRHPRRDEARARARPSTSTRSSSEDDSMSEGTTDGRARGRDRHAQRDLQDLSTATASSTVERRCSAQDVLREPVAAIVEVGTAGGVPPTSPAAAPSGTRSRSASPAATGRSTPATATTAACSSTSAPGRRTAAPGYPAPDQPRDPDRRRDQAPRRLRRLRRLAGLRRRASACRSDAPPEALTSHRMTHLRRSETSRAGGGAFAGGTPRPAADQAARAELRDRRQHRAPDRPRVRASPATTSCVEVGPGLGSLTLALLDVADRVVAIEVDAVLAAALPAHDRGVRPRPGRPVRGGPRRRAAGHRAPRPAADRAGRQPALQRLGAGAAAPAGAAALARARPGDGAVRGRRPAGRAARAPRRTASRRSRPPGTPTYAAPARSAATSSGRRRTSTPAWSPGPAATRRSRPPPGSRSSRSSTPRSPSAARRCAARCAGIAGSAEAAEAALAAAGVDPLARGESLGVDAVRPDRREAADLA